MTSSLLGLLAYEDIVRELALAYPESREERIKSGKKNEYGEEIEDCIFKVRDKTFAVLGWERGSFWISVKLLDSRRDALKKIFARPEPAELGQHGWVRCVFGPGDEFTLGLVTDWIEESFRLVAPKKLLGRMDQC